MSLNQWKKMGNISIWSYNPLTPHFPGWGLSADKSGYKSLRAFLTILETSTELSKRTIQLDLVNEGYSMKGQKRVDESKLVIIKSSNNFEWKIYNSDGKLYLEIGLNMITPFISSIDEAIGGKIDFYFGKPLAKTIWFW
jgi:hypothetical protein